MGRGIKIKGITLLLLICILGYWHHTIPEYKIKSSISMENPTERQTICRGLARKNRAVFCGIEWKTYNTADRTIF